MFEVKKASKKSEASVKSVRFTNDLIRRLEQLAFQNDISFNRLVVQCCEYALKHLDKDIKAP